MTPEQTGCLIIYSVIGLYIGFLSLLHYTDGSSKGGARGMLIAPVWPLVVLVAVLWAITKLPRCLMDLIEAAEIPLPELPKRKIPHVERPEEGQLSGLEGEEGGLSDV